MKEFLSVLPFVLMSLCSFGIIETGQFFSVLPPPPPAPDCLVCLVVKASASRAKVPGSNPYYVGFFSGLSLSSDLQIGTPVATLPGA